MFSCFHMMRFLIILQKLSSSFISFCFAGISARSYNQIFQPWKEVLKNPNNFKYGRTSSLYLKQKIFQSLGGNTCMAYLDLQFTFQMPREMTISSKRPRKSVNHERNGKSLYLKQKIFQSLGGNTCMAYLDLQFTFQMPREMTISSKRPRKSVNHERNGKSRVDPPPSPSTPTSYRQLFCTLGQV